MNNNFQLDPSLVNIADSIVARIAAANKILVIASQPVDADSCGTSIAFTKWLELQGKQVELRSAGNFPLIFDEAFPPAHLIQQTDFATLDFSQFDLYFVIDGSALYLAFGNNNEVLIPNIDKKKLVLIDHHKPSEVAAIAEGGVLVREGYSTVETLWPYLLATSDVKSNLEIAELLYYAHVGDTGRFKLVNQWSYKVADDLLAFGVDHHKMVDSSMDKDSFTYTGFCIEHTHFHPAARTLVLSIGEKEAQFLTEHYGEDWIKRDLDSHYKSKYLKGIKGFDYGFTLEYEPEQVKLRWRVKDNAVTLEVAPLMTEAGFENVGGHRNAGGGIFRGSVEEAEKRIVAIMEKYLPTLG